MPRIGLSSSLALLIIALQASCGNPFYTGNLVAGNLVGAWAASVEHDGQEMHCQLILHADGAFTAENIPLRRSPGVVFVSTHGHWELYDVSHFGRSYLPRWELILDIPYEGRRQWNIMGQEVESMALSYDLDINTGKQLVFRRQLEIEEGHSDTGEKEM